MPLKSLSGNSFFISITPGEVMRAVFNTKEGRLVINIHSAAEPFFITGSPEQAILFLHGLTASPSEVYPTALYLNQHYGYTVSGPLLPGHGSHPRFLKQTSWQDWYTAAGQELSFLLSNYKQVWVAGLSMGGLLSLHAARWVQGLQGAISINAPIYPRGSALIPISSLVKFVCPYHKKSPGWDKLAAQGRYTYDVIPVKAFNSMMSLKNAVKKEAGEISIPVLIMQATQDDVVWPKSGSFLAKAISRSILFRLERSEHIATMGEEMYLVGQAIADFIKTSSEPGFQQGTE